MRAMAPSSASVTPAARKTRSARRGCPSTSAMMKKGTSAIRRSDSRLGMVRLMAGSWLAGEPLGAPPDELDGVLAGERVAGRAVVGAGDDPAARGGLADELLRGLRVGRSGADAGGLAAEAGDQPHQAVQGRRPPRRRGGREAVE